MKRIAITLLLCATAINVATIYAQDQQIRVFSHRGGRMEHDENTLSAFKASADAGYRGFETDIRMTSDGALVVTHDSTLERTTDGNGTLEEKTAEEIKQLNTKQGNKMLFIEDLLEFLKDKDNLYVEFEMKTRPESLYPQERLEVYCDKLYQMAMADKPMDADYVFTSSDTRALRTMQRLHPDAHLLLITGKPCCDETIDLCKAMGIDRLGATMDGTSRQTVRRAHNEGLIVSLWPGQSPADFMLGTYLGADYMCTDIPLQLKQFITEKMPELKVTY